MQTTIIIEDSSSSPDFIDDNPVDSAEISSGNIEPRADSMLRRRGDSARRGNRGLILQPHPPRAGVLPMVLPEGTRTWAGGHRRCTGIPLCLGED